MTSTTAPPTARDLDASSPSAPPRPLCQRLYVQVGLSIVLGVLLGLLWPDLGARLKPLGDVFVKLIKMVIAPIIFTTVVVGIARVGDLREVGRVGLKALLYFEVVTTVALVIGLVLVNLMQPGAGVHADPSQLDAGTVESYASATKAHDPVGFLMNIVPDSVVGAFAQGDILQVLLFSILFGIGLSHMREQSAPVVELLDRASHALFGVIDFVMKLAPIGAFGAMAFTVGRFGVGTLWSLGHLVLCVAIACGLFVVVVLGGISRLAGFSIFKLLRHLQEELLIVLGTSSSESVLPRMMSKLEHMGCQKSVVGLVVPTGYSFNLDGTSIYLTMAAVFIAQATGVHLSLGQQVGILVVLLLTSKGAAAVSGGGFITLAATLSSLGTIPVSGLALLLGIDRFMSGMRALTNLVGNAVATIVVARWEGALDTDRLRRVLDGEAVEPTPETAEAIRPEVSTGERPAFETPSIDLQAA